jgi:hypothetical protein
MLGHRDRSLGLNFLVHMTVNGVAREMFCPVDLSGTA